MGWVVKLHMDTELQVGAFFQILFLEKKIQHLQVLLVSMSSAENLWVVSTQYPDVSNEADVN